MTRLLIEAGEKVPVLALLDHCGPDIKYSSLDYLRFSLARLSMVNREERLRFLWCAIVWKIKAKSVQRHVKHSRLSENQSADNVAWSSVDMFEGSIRALQEYVIPPLAGKVTLFRAEQNSKIHIDPYGGWGRVAADGVDVYEVPGSHNNMLVQPQVQALGKTLKLCIDRQMALG